MNECHIDNFVVCSETEVLEWGQGWDSVVHACATCTKPWIQFLEWQEGSKSKDIIQILTSNFFNGMIPIFSLFHKNDANQPITGSYW